MWERISAFSTLCTQFPHCAHSTKNIPWNQLLVWKRWFHGIFVKYSMQIEFDFCNKIGTVNVSFREEDFRCFHEIFVNWLC